MTNSLLDLCAIVAPILDKDYPGLSGFAVFTAIILDNRGI
uniref:Uncharacterized protein n=1 Tax=[Tolypothrix] sp. PCC 7415 TaxID=373957 RepID=A0A2P0ZGA6_9CYAN|nr:hypothetical protein [[Tolypothrix] sp. PCC 7415]